MIKKKNYFNLNSVELKELNKDELITLTGGGFAHDVATALRFIFISGGTTTGYQMAVGDYAANKAKCGC